MYPPEGYSHARTTHACPMYVSASVKLGNQLSLSEERNLIKQGALWCSTHDACSPTMGAPEEHVAYRIETSPQTQRYSVVGFFFVESCVAAAVVVVVVSSNLLN